MKYDHPILIKNHELYSDSIPDGKGIAAFVWAPGHVGSILLLLKMPLMAMSQTNTSLSLI